MIVAGRGKGTLTGPVQEIVHGILTVHMIHMTGLHGIHTIVHLANLTMTEDVMIVVFETVTENATGVLKNVVHPPVMREAEVCLIEDGVIFPLYFAFIAVFSKGEQ